MADFWLLWVRHEWHVGGELLLLARPSYPTVIYLLFLLGLALLLDLVADRVEHFALRDAELGVDSQVSSNPLIHDVNVDGINVELAHLIQGSTLCFIKLGRFGFVLAMWHFWDSRWIPFIF